MKRKDLVNFIFGLFTVIILIIVIYNSGNLLKVETELNPVTLGYLTFNFTESDSNVIKLVDIKPTGDSFALKSNDFFKFKVSNNFKQDLDYSVLLEPIVNDIDGEYIKIYFNDNEEIDKSKITTLNNLKDLDGNKVLYTGKLTNKSSKDFTLKIWLSKEYKTDSTKTLSFKINIKKID